jgi:hypothetical protein
MTGSSIVRLDAPARLPQPKASMLVPLATAPVQERIPFVQVNAAGAADR